MKPKHILLLASIMLIGLYFAWKTQPIKENTTIKYVHDTILKVSVDQSIVDSLTDYKQALNTCLVLIKKKNFQIKHLQTQINENTTADDSSNFDNDYIQFLSKRYN